MPLACLASVRPTATLPVPPNTLAQPVAAGPPSSQARPVARGPPNTEPACGLRVPDRVSGRTSLRPGPDTPRPHHHTALPRERATPPSRHLRGKGQVPRRRLRSRPSGDLGATPTAPGTSKGRSDRRLMLRPGPDASDPAPGLRNGAAPPVPFKCPRQLAFGSEPCFASTLRRVGNGGPQGDAPGTATASRSFLTPSGVGTLHAPCFTARHPHRRARRAAPAAARHSSLRERRRPTLFPPISFPPLEPPLPAPPFKPEHAKGGKPQGATARRLHRRGWFGVGPFPTPAAPRRPPGCRFHSAAQSPLRHGPRWAGRWGRPGARFLRHHRAGPSWHCRQ
jgi:hypothetical protein